MPVSKTSWKKGQSGNPNGKPPGASKIALLRALLEPYAPELITKAKDMALEGDTTALRLCLERLVPPIKIKDEPVSIEGLKDAESLVAQGQAIVVAMGRGDITPNEATALMQTVASQARIIEIEDLEQRITALEQANG